MGSAPDSEMRTHLNSTAAVPGGREMSVVQTSPSDQFKEGDLDTSQLPRDSWLPVSLKLSPKLTLRLRAKRTESWVEVVSGAAAA